MDATISDLMATYISTYDGVPKGSRWENRLVEAKSGANVVLKCEYDGLGRGARPAGRSDGGQRPNTA